MAKADFPYDPTLLERLQKNLERKRHQEYLQQLTPEQKSSRQSWVDAIEVEEKSLGTAPPATPVKLLTNWREILIALGYRNNSEDREKVRNINKLYAGPIIFPGQGAHPKVDKTKLIDWWNRLEAEWTVGYSKHRDAKPTIDNQHDYGRDGSVTPDIAGSVKKRRNDRQK